MIPSVKAIFAEHKKPSHCCKTDLLECMRPLLALVSKERAQSSQYRALLADAENDPELPNDLRGKLEMLNQTEAACERATAIATEALRELTKISVQRDRQYTEASADLAKWEKRNGR